MYILHYTWPEVMSAKQDESKDPEEPVVPRLCPQCAAVVPVVFLAGNVPRGEARELLSAPPRPAHHQALSPKIHTTWKTQNNRQQQQGQNHQNTHTTSKSKRETEKQTNSNI